MQVTPRPICLQRSMLLARVTLRRPNSKDASDALIGAHDTQTKLLSQEAGGGEMEMTFIMAHAQDTLMTTMILEKQARFTIDAYKRIAELEAKLA